MHYIPLLIAPHPSPWLPKTSCFQGFLLVSADPGDSSEGSTTCSCTSCHEFSLQELNPFLLWDLGGEHSAEQCLQPCSDRAELCSHPEELPKIQWTPKHTAEQQYARTITHKGPCPSWGNGPKPKPICKPQAQMTHLFTLDWIQDSAVSTSNSGNCSNWDLNQRLWAQFMFNIWSYFAHCNTVWRPMLLFFLIAWRHTVGWKTMFLYSQDLWFPKYIFSFLNIRTTEL